MTIPYVQLTEELKLRHKIMTLNFYYAIKSLF